MSKGPESIVASDVAEALGRLLIVWGSIEHELEGIISAIFRIAPVQRPAISAGLAIRPKVEMIRAGVALSGPFLDQSQRKKYDKKLTELQDLANKTRNFVAHFAVFENDKGQLAAGKIYGGKKPRYQVVILNKAYFDAERTNAGKLRDDLRIMRLEVKAAFDEFEKAWRDRKRP